jgi:hypothetical protein
VFGRKRRGRRWDSKARVIGRSKLESANGKPVQTARVAVRSTASGVNVARAKVKFVPRHGAERPQRTVDALRKNAEATIVLVDEY